MSKIGIMSNDGQGQDVIEIENSEILSTDVEHDKLVRVNQGTYLRMKELTLNPLDIQQVKQNIEKYNISEEVANDILRYCASVQEKSDGKVPELVIYTPKFAKEEVSANKGARKVAALNPQASYYYEGYQKGKYFDEIWYGTNSPEWFTIKTGTVVKSYLNTVINNTASFAVGAVADQLKLGTAYSLAQVFMGDPITTYAASDGDVWQAQLNESKWRKYTSIQLYDSVAKKYIYSLRAVSERSIYYFKHRYYSKAKNTESIKSQSDTSEAAPNYYNLDQKAFMFQNDFRYNEGITKYSVNKLTYFSSIQ